MELYSYWRSTTAYRVRIALNLKALDYQIRTVNLVAGEHNQPDYLALNPGHGVPTLVLEDGHILTQSMAILDWLEEAHPDPALLVGNAVERAHQRAAALTVATDIHPVNNLKVLKKLKQMGCSDDDTVAWMRDWMQYGFAAFQTLIRDNTLFCFGEQPGLADICLVPQLYNAHRWGVDLSPFARLTEIETRCLALPAFDNARPENQPDAT
ncbi:MAG: maleylacetoacetate isomerase [Rhizobiaceae bacterium]